MSKKKSIQSARKNSNKSPLDMHDFTKIISKNDQDPDFTKFSNVGDNLRTIMNAVESNVFGGSVLNPVGINRDK